MAENQQPTAPEFNPQATYMPDEKNFQRTLAIRHQRGVFGRFFYYISIFLAILALITLFANVINQSFGATAAVFTIDPDTLSGDERTLSELNAQELADILVEYVPGSLPVLIRDNLSAVPSDEFVDSTLAEILPEGEYPEGLADTSIRDIRSMDNAAELLAEFMALNLDSARLQQIVLEEVAELQVVRAWSLLDSVFRWAPSDGEQERFAVEIPAELADIQAQIDPLQEQIDDLSQEVTDLREAGAAENRDAINAANARITELRGEIADLQEQREELYEEAFDLIDGHILSWVEFFKYKSVYASPSDGNLETVPAYLEFLAEGGEVTEMTVEVTRYQSWLDLDFLRTPMSSTPAAAGIRTALLGSLYMMAIVIVVALPLGVGTAIYLEEYADRQAAEHAVHNASQGPLGFLFRIRIGRFGLGWLFVNLSSIIETNVRTLAGVPSIIYGLLGLAIIVRAFAPVTSGILFGVNVDVPEDDRVVAAIERGMTVDLLLDDEGNYSGVADPLLTQEQADQLYEAFRQYGDPANPLDTVTAINTIADALGIEVTVDEASIETIADVDNETVTLETGDYTFEQFEELVGALQGFSRTNDDAEEAPNDEAIVAALEEAIAIEFMLDTEGNYAGIAVLNEEQADRLFEVFQRLGTPGPSNVWGFIDTVTAINTVAEALGIEVEVDEANITQIASVDDETVQLQTDEYTLGSFVELVSALENFASFTVNGRTILSAALTLTLLILPIVIINAQEALRAVPFAVREASYGLGATKWQTIWRTVLPAAVPGIMTGMILSISRAVGETAPLIVVGASTFILTDPSGPFSNFTVLPIQIFNWTARPQPQFQFIAAAAIIVLLVMVVSLNGLAIWLRNRYSIRY